MFIFDGPNKRVRICEECIAGGVAQFTVNELWSRYVDWVAQGDNSKYLPAMRVIGGDSIGGGQYLGTYLFFRNDLGWLGVPPPVDGVTIVIDGAFYLKATEDDSRVLLLKPTVGTFIKPPTVPKEVFEKIPKELENPSWKDIQQILDK